MTASASDQHAPERAPTARRTVGLLADPGAAAELARRLGRDLPDLLGRQVGGSWGVEPVETELELDENGALPVVEIGSRALDDRGWDAVVLISDLPRRAGTEPVAADGATGHRVGLLSLPALGAVAQYRRARDTVLRLVADHLVPGGGDTRSGAAAALTRLDASGERTGGDADPEDTDDAGSGGAEEAIDVRLAMTGARGRMRLLLGLVRANRPWRLVPSLAPALAAAAAGAAFGIFYSNIWSLATALGIWRQVVVCVMALVAMVVWLILNNRLWERRTDRSLREEATLSNASTVLTVAVGVLCMFVLVFVIALVGSVIVIPGHYLASNLGREWGVDDYLMIAWLSCSMGTVAGALGSGFADEKAVRQAAYSQRELERRRRLDEQDSSRR
ncbi:hypothetical protein [Pseudonocardia endophytica]|uniref:Uncharacterized protein n=1 Tax=Pseudonocardia endophytica TaxID=401976 RepID=A0A4R1HKL8_PSEEN|nr:hypothetical protein [Pseudonocardia endophytica]TCK21513.1 hypothetical protein EV378_5501 [Pseudonocardia endophytica]